MKTGVVAILALAGASMAPAVATAMDGGVIYAQTCARCHATGVAGAPKAGDKAAWNQRLALGRDAMLATVLKGRGAMPPKGGNASLSDAEAKAAADYLVNRVK